MNLRVEAHQVQLPTSAAVVALVGRQGCGKGTQAGRLVERLGFEHVATGDLLRAAIAAGTPLGQRVQTAVTAGELIPDAVVTDLVAERLASTTSPVLLDGFPRTVGQAAALNDHLGRSVDLAVHLVVPRRVAFERLLRRVVCETCGTPSTAGGPDVARECERCGGPLVRRRDDNEGSIARRLALFEEETEPMLSWFGDQGRLVEVDADQDPDVVTEQLIAQVVARSVPPDPGGVELAQELVAPVRLLDLSDPHGHAAEPV